MAFHRRLLSGTSIIALTGALAFTGAPSRAQTIQATTPADVTTAINDANAGGTVNLDIAPAVTIDLTATTLPAYATAGGSLTINLGGTLANGSFNFSQPVMVDLTATATTPATISTALQGTGALMLEESGAYPSLFNRTVPTLILSGTNTYTGGTQSVGETENGLQVVFQNAAALPTTGKIGPAVTAGAGFAINQTFINSFATNYGGLNGHAALAADSANNLDFTTLPDLELGAVNGTWTYSGAITGNGTNHFIYFGGGNGTLIVSQGISVGTVLQGFTDHQSFGPDVTILTGTNTYAGQTQVWGGTLEFATAASFSPNTHILGESGVTAFGYAIGQSVIGQLLNTGSNVTLALGVDDANNLNFTTANLAELGSFGNVTYSGALTPGSLGYNLGGGSGNLTVSSVLADNGGATALTVNREYNGQAPGTAAAAYPSVILTNTDTYTGVTTVDLGVLQLGNGVTNGLLTATSQVTAPTGTNSNAGFLAFDEATPVTFSAPFAGAVVIEQDGPATVTLTGTNTNTGLTYVKAGTLAVGTGGALSQNSAVYVASTGTLAISGGGAQTVLSLAGAAGGVINLGANSLTLNRPQYGEVGLYNNNIVLDPGSSQSPGAPNLVTTSGIPDFRGVIEGSGTLIPYYGAQILSGINTFTGGVNFTGNGDLYLGDGTSVGTAGTGPISGAGGANFGTLIFLEPTTTTIPNAITGNVGLEDYGEGPVILTGANNFIGVTEIANASVPAVLQLGDGTATTTLGTGGVFDGGQLVFKEGSAVTFANVISDYSGLLTGAVTQDGPGTVTLDGVNTYTGLTDVAGGTLIVGDAATPGAKVGGNVQIDAAGTLGGYGTVMGNVVNNGILAPSNLRIHGNLTEGSASDLLIAVTPAGSSLVTIGGTAALQGTVTFAYAPGTYAPATDTFLTSTGLGGHDLHDRGGVDDPAGPVRLHPVGQLHRQHRQPGPRQRTRALPDQRPSGRERLYFNL